MIKLELHPDVDAIIFGDAEETPAGIVMPCQTHTCNVAMTRGRVGETFPDTDALVTGREELMIGVRTADCVPLLLYASDIREVAAVHAGWRGTLGGIAANTVEMLKEHGASAENIYALFGPAICGACYEVSLELAADFAAAGLERCIVRNDEAGNTMERPHLDLVSANIRRLRQSGVPAENIRCSGYCTLHSRDDEGNPLFHSWRRTPGTTRRIVSAVRLRAMAGKAQNQGL